MSDGPDEDRFRAAVRSLNAGSYVSELALGSLLASVSGNPRYELIAREEMAPRAGELDLHLEGEEVVGHSANAAAFGQFVLKVASSVKVIARESMGRQRMVSDLMVEPGPGSIRVVFRTPDPVSQYAIDADDEAGLWSDPNQQSVALLRVSQLLAAAEPTSEGASTVDAIVELLPPKARPALVDVVNTISREEWSVSGEFRQRGLGVQPIALTQAGARRLRTALQVRERMTDHLTLVGRLDGHRRARSLCWFVPESGPREITAVVPDPEMMVTVAELSLGDRRVRATFAVTTTFGPGSNDQGSRSYALESVDEVVNERETLM